MNSQLYVSISIIIEYPAVGELTKDPNVIAEAVSHSDKVKVSEDKTMIKPNVEPLQRTTVIVRDVPENTKEEVCILKKKIIFLIQFICFLQYFY